MKQFFQSLGIFKIIPEISEEVLKGFLGRNTRGISEEIHGGTLPKNSSKNLWEDSWNEL